MRIPKEVPYRVAMTTAILGAATIGGEVSYIMNDWQYGVVFFIIFLALFIIFLWA